MRPHVIIGFLCLCMTLCWSCKELKIVATDYSGNETSGDGDSDSDGNEYSDADSDSDTDTDTDSDTGRDSNSEIDSVTGTATDTASDTHTATETDTDADTGSITDTESETEDVVTCDTEGKIVFVDGSWHTLAVNGVDRRFILHVPDTYTGIHPVPLVIEFHMIGMDANSLWNYSIYRSVTDIDNAIMAYPNGAETAVGKSWNVGNCCSNGDDVAFSLQLVDYISSKACIDRSRVYAVGNSMGGGMANRLACDAADVFAGIISSSFDLDKDMATACTPSHPITTIAFRGSADTFIPFDGGPGEVTIPGYKQLDFLGAYKSLAKWADINNCSGEPTKDKNGCLVYGPSQCDGGVEEVLCVDEGATNHVGSPSIAWPILKMHKRQ